MSEMMITKDVVIDELENVVTELEKLTNRKIEDIEIIKSFINEEVATKYYMDQKLNSRMEEDSDSVYLWLDTGFTDTKGKPIFISMLRNQHGYRGHITGTASFLTESVKRHFTRNKAQITKNYTTFLNKYQDKIKKRTIAHIVEENDYWLQKHNQLEEANELQKKMEAAGFVYEEMVVVEETEKVVDETVETEVNEEQEAITISLLWDMIEERDQYCEKLLTMIAELEKDKEVIRQLQEQNAEYKRAMVEMRIYTEAERERTEEKKTDTGYEGHEFLENNEKILVLGASEIGIDIMRGIAEKHFGFAKSDIEYETDYDKVVNFAHRVNGSTRYRAVILGGCPHKVGSLGANSSLVEKLKQENITPFAIDARNGAGKLKITKQSFRNALTEVYMELRKAV